MERLARALTEWAVVQTAKEVRLPRESDLAAERLERRRKKMSLQRADEKESGLLSHLKCGRAHSFSNGDHDFVDAHAMPMLSHCVVLVPRVRTMGGALAADHVGPGPEVPLV